MGLLPFLNQEKPVPHYYGDIVRMLFFLAALVMIITYPLVRSDVPFPFFVSIGIILAIGLVAGLTNPNQLWVMIADVIIAVLGFVLFEYYCVIDFRGIADTFFITNQFLAIDFFFAIYYATKTLRGYLVSRDQHYQ